MLVTTLAAVLQTAATPPASPSPPSCAAPEYAQLDFWVGEWEVRPFAGGAFVAKSRIEKLYGGCAIREHWMPFKGGGGGSLSLYDRQLGAWHQSWVDSSGSRVEFTGGMRGEAMVLTGLWRGVANGKDGLVRMTYTREQAGVRQLGEVSTDGGRTWGPSFDFLYLPAKE